jgi:hypothetical protein
MVSLPPAIGQRCRYQSGGQEQFADKALVFLAETQDLFPSPVVMSGVP